MNENWELVRNEFSDIKKFEVSVSSVFSNLHIALINLKIEAARLDLEGKPNGIIPISNYVENSLKDMENHLKQHKVKEVSIGKAIKSLDDYFKK